MNIREKQLVNETKLSIKPTYERNQEESITGPLRFDWCLKYINYVGELIFFFLFFSFSLCVYVCLSIYYHQLYVHPSNYNLPTATPLCHIIIYYHFSTSSALFDLITNIEQAGVK